MPGSKKPLKHQTIGELWFGIVLFLLFGLAPLPLLFMKFSPEPARISVFWGHIIYDTFVMLFELVAIFGLFLSAKELIRRQRRRSPRVDKLVADFLSGKDCTMVDGLISPFADPEVVWTAVLHLVQQDLSAEQISLLAAGPVEDLLALHGSQMIDRIEAEARRNPAFVRVLGGVWRRDMPSEIWRRVEVARNGEIW